MPLYKEEISVSSTTKKERSSERPFLSRSDQDEDDDEDAEEEAAAFRSSTQSIQRTIEQTSTASAGSVISTVIVIQKIPLNLPPFAVDGIFRFEKSELFSNFCYFHTANENMELRHPGKELLLN